MAVRQITVRVSAEMKSEFDTYAAVFRLNSSPLLKLLIAREWRLRRMEKLAKAGKLVKFPQRVAASGRVAVTAHVPDLSDVTEFDRYARNCGLNRDKAGAWLMQTELRERWLEAALCAGADL